MFSHATPDHMAVSGKKLGAKRRAGNRRGVGAVLTAAALFVALPLGTFLALPTAAQAAPAVTGANPLDPGFGANVLVFDPSMATADIQSQVDAIWAQQGGNEMGTDRYALLFEPGTYGTTADPLNIPVGYYTEVAGLGQDPGDVVINGGVTAASASGNGSLDVFWRSVSNLTINVAGSPGSNVPNYYCFGGSDEWAVSQAAPMRRVQVNGAITFMPWCDNPNYASGGFVADSVFNGGMTMGSQQQFYMRNSVAGSGLNYVWNQVFSGVDNAPAQDFGVTESDGTLGAYTTLDKTPVSKEKPYLYQDATGAYSVFVPSAQTNSSGVSWASGHTPGTSVSLSQFYVAQPGDSAATINAALAAGLNLILAPGVYNLDSALNVTNPDTIILGLGLATLTATNGNAVITTGDVPGIDIAGITVDAGPVNSPVLMQIGSSAGPSSLSSDPVALQDVFFRVGGPHAGKATVALQVNSSNAILDDLWIWRADHGVAGSVGWTVNTSNNGLVVNGDNVTATGLFVEHFQQYNVVWNGNGGEVVFFQNELPYDAPNQAAYMNGTKDGYAAFKVADNVTTFQGYGMGSYVYTPADPTIHISNAFEAPVTPGVQFHDILALNLSGPGTIDHVINGTGAASNSSNTSKANQVVDYPTITHVFSFNDFHGRIDPGITVPWAYTLESAALADPDNSMVVSAGDNFGASLFASAIAQDDPTIQVLNDIVNTPDINFKASAVGNHEFDQGQADLLDRVIGGVNADGSAASQKADWTYLGANVISAATGQPVLDPYYIYTLGNGLKVGVIGAVTDTVPQLVSPAGIDGLTFTDPVAAVNKYADQLKSQGLANIVIAVYHDGSEVTSSLDDALASGANFDAMVNDTDANVDAIINGHTHMVYDWTGVSPQDPKGLDKYPGRAIVQAGSYGSDIGQIDIAVDTGTGQPGSCTAQDLPVVDASQVDLTLGSMQQISDDVAAAIARSAILGNQTVGQVSADVTTAFTAGEWVTASDGTVTYKNTGSAVRDDRANESSLATLVANAFLDAGQSDQIGGADIGIINAGGGLRAELLYNNDGTINYAAANSVLPFANNVWTIDLTGAQFKEFLEEQWQATTDGTSPSRPFLATGISSNVTFTVNTDVGTATPCTVDSCTFNDPNSHITSVYVNGAPLDPNKTYKIVTISYLTAGGDNYTVMTNGTNAQDTGLLDRDLWINYLEKESGMTAAGQTPTSTIAPDFARASVVVSNLTPATAPMAVTSVTAGSAVTASLSRLDLTSLGSPANTTLSTYLVPAASGVSITGLTALATAKITAPGDTAGCAAAGVPADLNPGSNGCAKLDVTIPADTVAGDYTLVSVASPSGTAVSLPITVAAAAAQWPSAANSSVTISSGNSPMTGGPARLADGKDSYTITVTLRDANGQLLSGFADELAVGYLVDTGIPSNLPVFADNGDGTYSGTVTSTTPAATALTVYVFDGNDRVAIGKSLGVQFLHAIVENDTVAPGQSQTATATDFGWDEQVVVTLRGGGNTIALGTFTAGFDPNENPWNPWGPAVVTVTFTVPATSALGTYTVEFAGATSGMVSVPFKVVPAQAPEGGSVVGNGSLGALAMAMLLVSAACIAVATARFRRAR